MRISLFEQKETESSEKSKDLFLGYLRFLLFKSETVSWFPPGARDSRRQFQITHLTSSGNISPRTPSPFAQS